MKKKSNCGFLFLFLFFVKLIVFTFSFKESVKWKIRSVALQKEVSYNVGNLYGFSTLVFFFSKSVSLVSFSLKWQTIEGMKECEKGSSNSGCLSLTS